MLGCQDFCGYYDWTFAHVRREYGQPAVRHLWANAIGGESQKHYLDAARSEGLRGLLKVWTQTGEDEHCDWTFTLDEDRNVLRWDMRRCPSKGFLTTNDLQNDEDYCDHCVGWISPLLREAGVEIVRHEHNHCGQCWAEMSVAGRPAGRLDLAVDIRKDPRWGTGYVDSFDGGVKLPMFGETAADPCEVIEQRFAGVGEVLVLGRGPSGPAGAAGRRASQAVLVTDPTYGTGDVFDGDPFAVLVGDAPAMLAKTAKRFLSTDPARRPLLLHAYLPGMPFVDFASMGLPRPVPILPLLLRSGLYVHMPRRPYPTSGTFLVLLAAALGKPASVAGVDLFSHASGHVYARDDRPTDHRWPERHSLECELAHLRAARARLGDALHTTPELMTLLHQPPLTR